MTRFDKVPILFYLKSCLATRFGYDAGSYLSRYRVQSLDAREGSYFPDRSSGQCSVDSGQWPPLQNSKVLDPGFVEIGNKDLIGKRGRHPVKQPPGGTLRDYIPFYFTPFSPMLYNIKTGWGGIRQRDNDEIIIMVSSLRTLQADKVPFLFTDRHAYLVAAQFYSDPARLDQIDWGMLQRRDFRNNTDDPSKKERYQAEALIHKHLPVGALAGLVCYNDDVLKSLNAALTQRNRTIKVVKQPSWYF